MHTAPPRHPSPPARGLTLLELTVVIAVSLVLIGITFTGAKAWKLGAERASCVMNIAMVQKAVRAYSAERGYEPGLSIAGNRGSAPMGVAPQQAGSQASGGGGELAGNALLARITGEGNYLEQLPECSGGGRYRTMENSIPQMGQLYMKCSLSGTLGHIPSGTAGW